MLIVCYLVNVSIKDAQNLNISQNGKEALCFYLNAFREMPTEKIIATKNVVSHLEAEPGRFGLLYLQTHNNTTTTLYVFSILLVLTALGLAWFTTKRY